jgi:hypothetical protein
MRENDEKNDDEDEDAYEEECFCVQLKLLCSSIYICVCLREDLFGQSFIESIARRLLLKSDRDLTLEARWNELSSRV